MRYLLAPSNRDVLAQFAWSNVLVGLDFDGTLAPIVDDPASAQMRPRTKALLIEVARRYPCAVISGRSRRDVAKRLIGVPLMTIVGNHGLSSSRHRRDFEATVRRWLPALEAELGSLRGVFLEDKTASLAIHYRTAPRKRAARDAIVEAAQRLDDLERLVVGKMVVNVIPKNAPHKGMALERLRSACGADTALYVGDDVTDEDAFELDQPGRFLGIRVGRSSRSAAAYFLQDQREIDAFLRILVTLRTTVRPSARLHGALR